MRVTNLSTTQQLIQQIFDRRLSLDQVRQEISSGIKVDVGSKEPGQSGSIVNLQQTSSRIDRHKQRIAYATGFLEHQETTLNSVDDILVRAQEIAEQGANESLSWEDRVLLSDEVFQLRDQLVSFANTTYQGKYIYGAADDDDPPFDAVNGGYTNPSNTALDANKRYVFDNETGTASTDTRSIQVTDDDTVRINSSGGAIFSNALGAMDRLGRALAGYQTTLTAGLPDGGGTAYVQPQDYHLQTADIRSALDALGSARTNDIIRERSSVGSRIARMEQVTGILDGLKVSTENARSSLQDSDIFEASANFQSLQTSLQALLASGAQINNLSLLNYL